jgi:hypothetical protein
MPLRSGIASPGVDTAALQPSVSPRLPSHSSEVVGAVGGGGLARPKHRSAASHLDSFAATPDSLSPKQPPGLGRAGLRTCLAAAAKMDDAHAVERDMLRSMWELPSVVHFSQTFRMQFKLRKFSPDVSPASSSSLPASVA